MEEEEKEKPERRPIEVQPIDGEPRRGWTTMKKSADSEKTDE